MIILYQIKITAYKHFHKASSVFLNDGLETADPLFLFFLGVMKNEECCVNVKKRGQE